MTERTVRIKVNKDIADKLEELFENGTAVVEDGGLSRKIAQKLKPFRKKEKLTVGHDRKLGKSILHIKGVEPEERKNVPFSSVTFKLKEKL